MELELRQLERFLSVAQSGSLSTAASVLGVAQPVLSRDIKQLEDELRAKLFYRHGRGTRLTEAGLQFRVTVAPLVRKILQAKSELAIRTGASAGSVSLAMPPSLSATIGPRLVRVLLTRCPNMKLHYLDGYSGHVNEWIVTGRVDMAVVNNGSRSYATQMDPLLTTDLFFVVHRDIIAPCDLDPETIPFGRAASIPMVLPARPHGLRRVLDVAARKQAVEYKVIAEVDALETIKVLVQSKIGATILPQGPIIFNTSDPGKLIVRRLVKPNVNLKFMGLHIRPNDPSQRLVHQLSQILREEIREAIENGRIDGRI